ncbi:MAG: DUF2024 family protein [Bacteroidota bacterium]
MKNFILAIGSVLIAGFIIKTNTTMETTTKKVNVWDTYVTKKDGQVMHFDILVPVEITDTNAIYAFGKDYLRTKGQKGQELTSKQCRLCHIERLRPEWETAIDEKGYFIIEMEGCN